jgi:hypothetical protein
MSNTSTGVNFLGIPLILSYIESVLDRFPNYKNKIISIGSGGGYIEFVIDKILKTDIICIDPDPLSYITDKTIYKQPNYKTIYDEDFNIDKYKGKCIIFLNWPTPEQNNGYDIDSILKLDPICIIPIVECGIYRGSGSIGFHDFLNYNNVLTDCYYSKNMDLCDKPDVLIFPKYYSNNSTSCFYSKPGYDSILKFTILILSKKQFNNNLPISVYPYDSARNKNDYFTKKIRDKWENRIENIYKEDLDDWDEFIKNIVYKK